MLRDLLGQIQDLTLQSSADSQSSASAVTALGHAARALSVLSDDYGYARRAPLARRRLVVRELAQACRAAAEQWPPAAGRLPDLTGAAADVLGRQHLHVDSDAGWSAAIEVSGAVRGCVELAGRFPPYTRLPTLLRTRRVLDAVERIAAFDPPARHMRAAVDIPIPPLELTADSTQFAFAADSVAGLVDALGRDARADTLHLYGVLAAAATAESAARLGTAVANTLGEPTDRGPWVHAPGGWRVLQAALVRFDDGSRRNAPTGSSTLSWALQLQRSIENLRRPVNGTDIAELATTARAVANQLPAIAGHIDSAVARWAAEGKLLARARSLPSSEEHVLAVIRDKIVVATSRDVGPVLVAGRVTRRLSSALAVELDRSSGRIGDQPQPHLLASLAADTRAALLTGDAQWARRLVARCDSFQQPNRQLAR